MHPTHEHLCPPHKLPGRLCMPLLFGSCNSNTTCGCGSHAAVKNNSTSRPLAAAGCASETVLLSLSACICCTLLCAANYAAHLSCQFSCVQLQAAQQVQSRPALHHGMACSLYAPSTRASICGVGCPSVRTRIAVRQAFSNACAPSVLKLLSRD